MFTQAVLSPNHRIATTGEDLTTMVEAMRQHGTRGFDFETSGLRYWDGQRPIGVALGYWDNGPRAWYVPVRHQTMEPQADVDAAKRAFKDALAGADALVGHNLKFDLNMARADGWEVEPWVQLHDTMVQAYLINENRSLQLERVVSDEECSPYGDSMKMKDEVSKWIETQARRHRMGKRDYLSLNGHQEVPVSIEAEYACRDIGHTLALHRSQYRRAHDDSPQRPALYANEMLLVRALADMEYQGQPVDTDYLKRVSCQLDAELEDRGKTLVQKFGLEIEWNNDNQLRDLLFTTLKLPMQGLTKRGAASVDRSALMGLIQMHKGIDDLMEWRARFKVRSTYTDSLIAKVDDDNRLHASFVQSGTATGRLSSRNPNLQNIPSRHPVLSKMVRRAFVTDPNQARIYCDYSQIELRVLAWATQCPTLLKAYDSEAYMMLLDGRIDRDRYMELRRNEASTDVHGLVAQTVFGVHPTSDDFKAKRSASKIINFGVPYGGGPNLLMGNPALRLPEEEAKKYFRQYHAQNPEISHAQKRLFDHMRRNDELSFTNWAGRKRHGPRLEWQRQEGSSCPVAEEERSMFASLVQGSAGELTRFSLVRLWYLQVTGRMPAITTSTVHDEVQVDCDVADAEDVARAVRAEMEDFTGMFGPTPVIADLEITTTNWADKQEMEL